MIIKHFDPKNGTCFFNADEFITKTCYVREYYKGALRNVQKQNIGSNGNVINEHHYYDQGRSSTEYQAMAHTIRALAETPNNIAPQFVIKGNYEDLDKVLVVIAKEEEYEKNKVLVFNSTVYLMNEAGKTIEKLI